MRGIKFYFNETVNRRNTDSLKWDGIEEHFGIKENELLPMWVADMEFKTPKPILDAIKRKIEHGVLGYAGGYDEYFETVVNWMHHRHQWKIKKEWIVPGGSIASTLSRIIRTFTKPGDKVIVQPPVFPLFFRIIRGNGREVVSNPLKLHGNKYSMDFDDLEKRFDSKVKLMLLCSPHNPIGKVWTKDELIRLGELCIKNNVIIVSDEIHAEMIFSENNHITFGSISNHFSQNSVICTSPNKAFNMSGLEISNTIIPNDQMRSAFKSMQVNDGVNRPNLLGIEALKAAYNECEEWLSQAIDYCEENYQFLCKYLKIKVPEVEVIALEGTYLVWLNCRQLGLRNEDLEELLIKEGKLLLSQGYTFGYGGQGFVRMNIACPRAMLEEALERFTSTIRN